MDKKITNFDEWFLRQHGERPGGDATTSELNNEVLEANIALNRANHIYSQRLFWDSRRTSALWAWNARGEGEEHAADVPGFNILADTARVDRGIPERLTSSEE